MTEADSNAFLLNVETRQLTRALKLLCRVEPRAKMVRLEYGSGMLTISAGGTSQAVAASGVWPSAVFVEHIWAKTFARKPFETAVTVLRVADGGLDTNGHRRRCSSEPWTEEIEATRAADVEAARRLLEPYGVSQLEIDALIDAADSEIARLWGPGDGSLIDEIASAWLRWAVHGVEPSDIRRIIDRKSKELWKSGRHGGDLFARYDVGEDDETALIEGGDQAKSWLCLLNVRRLGAVAQAWKRLVLYGVQPTDILRLMEGKSRSRTRAKTQDEMP